MNAYELAKLLDFDAETLNWKAFKDAANMLRQQADRIAELENESIFWKDLYKDLCNVIDEYKKLTPQTKPLNNDETEDLIKELIGFMAEDSYTELDKIVFKTVNTLRDLDRQVSILEKELFMLQRHYDQLDSTLKGGDK